jgi:hypothetical protein
MKIMTHGGITNIVRDIGLALGFESGESWSGHQLGPKSGRAKVYKTFPGSLDLTPFLTTSR